MWGHWSILLTVSDDEEVYVYFSMTENQMLSLLRQYGSVDKALADMPKVSLQLSDGVKYAHEGVIDAISGTIDTGTGAVSLRAVFPNPEGMLRNGSTARGCQSACRVPESGRNVAKRKYGYARIALYQGERGGCSAGSYF